MNIIAKGISSKLTQLEKDQIHLNIDSLNSYNYNRNIVEGIENRAEFVLDFTTNTYKLYDRDYNVLTQRMLESILTVTRASKGMHFDNTGYLTDVAENTARFVRDPATGKQLGLLVEKNTTNLLTYTDALDNAAWFKSDVSITPRATMSPAGKLDAFKVIANTNNTQHYFLRNSTIVNGTIYTQSIYAKASEYNWVQVFISTRFDGGGGAFRNINLTTGALGSGTLVVSVENAGNGWWRISATRTATSAGTDGRFAFTPLASDINTNVPTFAGNGTSGIFVYGPQLEPNAIPTSLIHSPALLTSRASTKTVTNSIGQLITLPINTIAEDHVFMNNRWVSRGNVFEPAATNLLTNSLFVGANGETAPTGWAIAFNTGVTATASSPRCEGAIRTTQTASNQREYYQQSVTLLPNTTYTLSAYFAAGLNAIGGIMQVSPSADTPTGTTLFSGTGLSGNATYSMTFTTGASGGVYAVRIGVGVAANTTGTVIFETPQLEVGTTSTSYIPTNTSGTASRAADVSTTSTTVSRNLDYVFRNLTNTTDKGFTLMVEFDILVPSNDTVIPISLSNGLNFTGSVYATIQTNGSYGAPTTSPATPNLFPSGTFPAKKRTRHVLSYDRITNTMRNAVDGVFYVGGTPTTPVPFINLLTLGKSSWNSGAGSQNMSVTTVYKAAFIPTILTDEEMRIWSKA